MSKRTAKFVSAIIASLLASANLTTASDNTASAASNCLSEPKGATPEGKHWYYRIDHATKRQCWYMRDEGGTPAKVAGQEPSRSQDPVSSPKGATTRPSIANARAEFLPQSRVEQETDVPATQRLPAPTANIPNIDNDAAARGGDNQTSAVASRWPELSGATSSSVPQPSTNNTVAELQSNTAAAAPPPPTIAPVPLAAANALSGNQVSSENQSRPEKPPGSVHTLLIVLLGALAAAGLMGSAVLRLGSKRRANRRNTRRVNWDAVDIDRSKQPNYASRTNYASQEMPAYTNREMPARRVDFPHEPRATEDPVRRIEEMLAQLAKGAAN